MKKEKGKKRVLLLVFRVSAAENLSIYLSHQQGPLSLPPIVVFVISPLLP
jgi:hypothetical protein